MGSHCRTVAIPCVWYHKGYPVDEQANVALRTLRRCLEKLQDKIDALVLVAASADEAALYTGLLPLYFPRTPDEVTATLDVLPESCWHPWGEITVEERKIRVSNGPFDSSALEETENPIFSSDDRGFLEAKGDADSDLSRRLEVTMTEAYEKDVESATHVFIRYMRRARELPTEPFDRRFVFRVDRPATGSGSSSARRIIVLLGARIPNLGVRDERTLALFVKELELLKGERFQLLYVNACVDALDASKLEVLQEMLTVISARYQNSLDLMMVLHPGFRFRAAFLCGYAVSDLAARAWNDTVYIEALADLHDYGLVAEQLELPQYVWQFDTNGG